MRGDEAKKLQSDLRRKLIHVPLPPDIRLVAGADMALSKKHGLFFSAVAVMTFPALEIVEIKGACVEASYPYIPGLLSFREGPAILAALKKLENTPDVIVFDGQGIAHPRGFGLAAHIGLFVQIPSVGCAKSRLVGDFEKLGAEKGSWQPLTKGKLTLGSVLRTRSNVKPVFVSSGHLCNITDARELILKCVKRYRLPEPTRIAHKRVSDIKRDFIAKKEEIQ